jgi:hypothetical protein
MEILNIYKKAAEALNAYGYNPSEFIEIFADWPAKETKIGEEYATGSIARLKQEKEKLFLAGGDVQITYDGADFIYTETQTGETRSVTEENLFFYIFMEYQDATISWDDL